MNFDPKRLPKQKLLAIFAFAAIKIIIAILTTSPNPSSISTLDPNWQMGIPSALLNGNFILGRDMIFTYGPLFQFITALGVKLHLADNSIYSHHLLILTLTVFETLIISIIVFLLPVFNWVGAAILILLANIDLRFLLLFVTIVFLSRAFIKTDPKNRFIWAATTALFAFLSQLYSFDIGIYVVVTVILAGLIFSSLSYLSQYRNALVKADYLKPKEYGMITTIILILITLFNIIVSGIFYLTSPSYKTLFQYQELSIEIVKGYVNNMGLIMSNIYQLIFSVLIILLVVMWILALGNFRDFTKSEKPFFINLLIVASLLLKSSLHRSDYPHLEMSLSGISFFWLIAWRQIYPISQARIYRKILWNITAIVLFSLIVIMNFIISSRPIFQFNSRVRNESLFSYSPDVNELDKRLYKLPAKFQTIDELMLLGVENYVGPLHGIDLVTPTVQLYAINTIRLEQFFIQKTQEHNFPPIVINYALSLDNIQNNSRFPELFEFLYRYYHLSSLEHLDTSFDLAVLEQRTTPLPEIEWETVSAQISREAEHSVSVHFNKPIQCKLYKIDILMDYPAFLNIFGTPGNVEVLFLKDKMLVSPDHIFISPLKTGQVFSTIVSPLANDQLWQYFYDDSNYTFPIIDEINIQPWGQDFMDPLYISPHFEIKSVECVGTNLLHGEK